MKKILYLNSCSTCVRIMNEIGVDDSWSHQNIKEQNISEKDLDMIYAQTGSYEKIFSKRAMKYKSMGLKEIIKSDEEYKKYILEEYTLISRPIIEINGKYFIGNSKKNIAAIIEELNK